MICHYFRFHYRHLVLLVSVYVRCEFSENRLNIGYAGGVVHLYPSWNPRYISEDFIINASERGVKNVARWLSLIRHSTGKCDRRALVPTLRSNAVTSVISNQ
jgi:hypothetical protein